jgi:putative phosphotransacetylase
MIKIGVSARHVHLCQKDLDTLFGEGYEFTKYKDTYNPGYVSEEKVDVWLGFEESFECRILLPATEVSQVELSQSNCKRFGIEAPLNRSFDLTNAGRCQISTYHGEISGNFAIRTKRHLHLTPTDADELDLYDGQYCTVEAGTVVFKEVLVRVKDWYKTSLHLDTDEGNAARVKEDTMAKVVRND